MKKSIVALAFASVLTSCGQSEQVNEFFGFSEKGKTRCDDSPFAVCLSTDSQIEDSDLEDVIGRMLKKMSDEVDSEEFLEQADLELAGAVTFLEEIRDTNYVVTVNTDCQSESSVLATADIGGDVITYNRCRVDPDEDGEIDEAHVAGILAHEITHNMGYIHAETNPSPNSVPYAFGDFVESWFGGKKEEGEAYLPEEKDRRWRKRGYYY